MGHALYTYLDDGISFISKQATKFNTIYFPLCGIDANAIKSAITPLLSGDIKIDSARYLTKPMSREDLRNSVRNFFCFVDGKGIVSFNPTPQRQGESLLEAGALWHKLTHDDRRVGIRIEALNFVPIAGGDVELMRVSVQNISRQTLSIVPTFSLPLFCRALANKHDHEHVSSLLHRISQVSAGVIVHPTMIFNEHGHQPNKTVYFVLGCNAKDQSLEGINPEGTFPTVESFYGEGGISLAPVAVTKNRTPEILPQVARNGQEAMGALRFKKIRLGPGKQQEYFIVMGIAASPNEAKRVFHRFNTAPKFKKAFEANKRFWMAKANTICFGTGNPTFNSWMHWVTLQPVLRRIFGCSFLPDHDYGKGGRGWRDLWQDLLSLILIEPTVVREMLKDNFAGVRIDGSNATIIGNKSGFMADRNAISRVWMDHGAWPFLTLLLYIHQTGDHSILFEPQAYFRDPQLSRARCYDRTWEPWQGNCLKTKTGRHYHGSVLEHVLVQHLVQFFNVGEHNITRLENADWNDGLDMAFERGESVAFTALYAGNLLQCAQLLEHLANYKNLREVTLAQELLILLDSVTGKTINYSSVTARQRVLFEQYFPKVQPHISGKQINVAVVDLLRDLRRKAGWVFRHIQQQERIQVGPASSSKNNWGSWYNGYYDNKGARVEGRKGKVVRMTLTGQVFPILSGLAQPGDIEQVIGCVRRYLKDKELGGYRLNTDFRLPHYMDLGRAFGFAYGSKENGSFFNHMAVMYAYALYARGFVSEGREVISSIFRMCTDTTRSRIYPGIPEYFDSQGRGQYHYLTGSASWLVLTMLTQVFGVRGENGDLILAPQLVKEEFDQQGRATVGCFFAGQRISITYLNKDRLNFGQYAIKALSCEAKAVSYEVISPVKIRIPRKVVAAFGRGAWTVYLGPA